MPPLLNKTGFNQMLQMFQVDARKRVQRKINGLITGIITQSRMGRKNISPGKAKHKNLSNKSITVISTPHQCLTSIATFS